MDQILIVDDLSKNIQVVASTLRHAGYSMTFAQSGQEALEKVAKKGFDLIILDVMMPEMDGFEVCRRLKDNPKTAAIPVIFLTAKSDVESTVQGFELGAVDYVVKPFQGMELLARVQTHLELKKAREELQKSNAMKDKFFSIIAHDLKSPFNGLTGLSSILERDYEQMEKGEIRRFIHLIHESASLAFELLEQLLDWSRSQAGKIRFVPESQDLFYLVQEVCLLHQEVAKKKKIQLTNLVQVDSMVYGDERMLTTVLRNLVSNAVKFTKAGGWVKVSAQKDLSHWQVTVEDNGVGIPPEDQARLFRLDAHLSKPGTENEEGTGLGLILCQEFIQKHQGSIRVESQVGQGSRFIFSLPIKEEMEDNP